MTLIELLENANTVTDESFSFAEGYRFINDAISRINIEVDADFPLYTANDENAEMPIPGKWQIALIVPFVAGRIKQVDASQFEFTQFFNEFFTNLIEFKAKYNIPDEYKDSSENISIAPDFTGNPMKGNW